MCGKVEIGCNIKEGFQSMITNQFDNLAQRIGEMAVSGLQAVSTFWIRIDSPTLSNEHLKEGCTPVPKTASCSTFTDTGPIAFLHSQVLEVSLSIFTLTVLVAGMRIAWEQRAEPLRELLKATMLFVLVSAVGTATLQLLTAWSDSFAMDLVQKATPKDQQFEHALGAMLLQGGAAQAAGQQLPLMVMMFFGIAVFVAAVIQIVLLLIRSAMLVLLAATFPLAAAATNTEVGKAWFKKYCAWALAFIAYKPAAALVYAAAMKMTEAGMTDGSGNGLVQALTGLMMMLLAVFALPALLRFAVPVTAAVAGGSAGMGGGAADPGGLATGAVSVGRSAMGGRSSSGGGGSSSGGGGGGSSATGALAVGASAGLAVAGAAITGAKKAGNALAGAASHSAGEAGGGGSSERASGSSSGGRGWGGSKRSSASSGGRSQSNPPPPPGPSGST
jgi:type IV secretion system protein TrbL